MTIQIVEDFDQEEFKKYSTNGIKIFYNKREGFFILDAVQGKVPDTIGPMCGLSFNDAIVKGTAREVIQYVRDNYDPDVILCHTAEGYMHTFHSEENFIKLVDGK